MPTEIEKNTSRDERNGDEGKVYQRRDGTRFVKSSEFARSKEGRALLHRFSESIETESEGDQ